MKNPFVLQTDTVLAQSQSFIDHYRGDNYIQELSNFLCETLNISYALVGYIDGDPNQITTAGLSIDGMPGGVLRYKLKGTPCENVVGKNNCFYPSGVQKLFPEDRELEEMKIEGYYGSPLEDSKGRPLGLIALLDTERIVQGSLLDKVMAVVTPRTQLELERMLSLTS